MRSLYALVSCRLSWPRMAVVVVGVLVGACSAPVEPPRHLLIVVDGLRPDYVTPETMPTLTALGAKGVVFNQHHSVYPTVTRVNASSMSTGAYPESHGLLGNSVFFPKVDAARFLDTSDRMNLLAIARSEGRLLTAPTLAESLQAAGRKMLVVSSGSSGSAFLNNHTVAGGAVLHLDYALPESLGEAMKAMGARPPDDAPRGALDAYAIDAFLEVGLPKVDPSITVMWLSDLDSAAHEKGMGDPATVDVLRRVDIGIKRIQDGLAAAGLLDRYNIWVTSDHGFSTYTGAANLRGILEPFAGSQPDGSPRIVSGGGAIYVRSGAEATVPAIVARLQETPGVGAIFTRAVEPGSFNGSVSGTLSFDAVRWSHDRSAQILYSPDWTDATNANGIPGTTASSGNAAGHGSSSPWDVHNTLIAAGPSLRKGAMFETPSANVDFAPTFLTLLGVTVPATMAGRPLVESFIGGEQVPGPATVRKTEHAAATTDGRYSVTARFSTLNQAGRDYRYFDGTIIVRK